MHYGTNVTNTMNQCMGRGSSTNSRTKTEYICGNSALIPCVVVATAIPSISVVHQMETLVIVQELLVCYIGDGRGMERAEGWKGMERDGVIKRCI